MSKRKLVLIALGLLVVAIFMKACVKMPPPKEWTVFLDSLVDRYDFIDKAYLSPHRRDISINFDLNSKMAVNDLKAVFQEVKLFLEDKEYLNSLNKYHKSRSSDKINGFGEINVFFVYKDDSEEEGKGHVIFSSDEYARNRIPPREDIENITFDEWHVTVNYKDYKYDSEKLNDLP